MSKGLDKRLKDESATFRKRADKLGFKQTELAILLDKTPRMVNFYIHGMRYIPADIWVRLIKIEETDREDLWQTIARVQKKLKAKKK